MALADSLAACGRLDEANLTARFTAWYRSGEYACTGRCFDIGIITRAALERWERSDGPGAASAD